MPSIVICAFNCNAARHELSIVFQSGRRYAYKDVPEAPYQGMKAAFSKGEYFNIHIRDHFKFVRNEESES
jgi:KTSC domain